MVSFILILVVIAAFSIGSQIYLAMKTELVRYLKYKNENAVNVYKCVPSENVNWFIVIIIGDLVGIYLPMLIVLVAHLLMFLVLREQAIRRSYTANTEISSQLQSISRRFVVIVCAFYICLLPKTILSNYHAYNVMSGEKRMSKDHVVMKMKYLASPLLNLNSCLNPLIYAKIHTKFIPGLRWVLRRFNGVVRGVTCCNLGSENGEVKGDDDTVKSTEIQIEEKIIVSAPSDFDHALNEDIKC